MAELALNAMVAIIVAIALRSIVLLMVRSFAIAVISNGLGIKKIMTMNRIRKHQREMEELVVNAMNATSVSVAQRCITHQTGDVFAQIAIKTNPPLLRLKTQEKEFEFIIA